MTGGVASLAASETVRDSLDVRRVYDIEGIRVIYKSPDQTIGNADIKELSSGIINTDTSIGSVIRDMPGVFLTERSKGESIVRFRGFEDRHIRVFLDGMPISDGYFGNYDLHLLSSHNVSRLFLVKGPVSHQYGFNTMGGVLNIITDNLDEENVLNANILLSSHGRTLTSLNGSYGIGRSQIYLNTAYLHVPGFVLPGKLKPIGDNVVEQGGKKRSNSGREQYSINMRYITDIAGLHTFTVASGYSYMPRKGNPPSIYDHAGNVYSKIRDWRKYNSSFSAKSNLIEALEITASSYYDQSEDTYIRYNNAFFETPLWESLIRTKTTGFHLNAEQIEGRLLQNNFGLRVERKSYERTGGPGHEAGWTRNSQSMSKFYHTIRYPAERSSFSLIVGNALSGFTHSQINDYNLFWEPQAGIVFYQGARTVSLAYGRTYQFPTMRELFGSTLGNPDLEPEKGHKVELSLYNPFSIYRYNGTLGLNLFYNRIDDLINRDRSSFYNLEKMSTYGAEMSINWSLLPALVHDYEVSYLKLDKNNSSVSLMEYPKLKLRLTHQYSLSDKFIVRFSSQWYGEALTYYREDDYFTLPSYFIHDLGMKYFYRRANLTLNINNLFDTYYEPQYGYPAAGREITLAVGLALF